MAYSSNWQQFSEVGMLMPAAEAVRASMSCSKVTAQGRVAKSRTILTHNISKAAILRKVPGRSARAS